MHERLQEIMESPAFKGRPDELWETLKASPTLVDAYYELTLGSASDAPPVETLPEGAIAFVPEWAEGHHNRKFANKVKAAAAQYTARKEGEARLQEEKNNRRRAAQEREYAERAAKEAEAQAETQKQRDQEWSRRLAFQKITAVYYTGLHLAPVAAILVLIANRRVTLFVDPENHWSWTGAPIPMFWAISGLLLWLCVKHWAYPMYWTAAEKRAGFFGFQPFQDFVESEVALLDFLLIGLPLLPFALPVGMPRIVGFILAFAILAIRPLFRFIAALTYGLAFGFIFFTAVPLIVWILWGIKRITAG